MANNIQRRRGFRDLLPQPAGLLTVRAAARGSGRGRPHSLALLAWLLTAVPVLWVEGAQAEAVITHPYRGLTYITRKEISPRPLVMHIVLINMAEPGLAFKLTPPGGTRDTVRQTTADFLNQEQAQVAIDAHFFLPFPSDETNANVVGLAASQGTVYSPFEPQPITPDYVDQSYAIIPYAAALNIDRYNRARIVHRDPSYADNKHVLERVTLWNAVAGSAQIITDGVKTIPDYSGTPTGLNPLYGYTNGNSWYFYPAGRTCIGLSLHSETLVLFTVDEAGGSDGMTVGEAADLLMADYHVYNALNLDGGGSTSMALQDPVTHLGQIVNVSGDVSAGRATGSNLAVFAVPYPPGPLLSLTVTATNGVIVSWPAPSTGWQLQENPGLAPTNWVNVCAIPWCVGDRVQVNLLPQAPGRFYRLMNR